MACGQTLKTRDQYFDLHKYDALHRYDAGLCSVNTTSFTTCCGACFCLTTSVAAYALIRRQGRNPPASNDPLGKVLSQG